MAESLSLTQTSEQSPHVFFDSSGSPLSVYLDVNPEILARPRLIRLLRVGTASGADICHNPSAAAILLINSETESGRKFVHDWRADLHKTVLDYGWIQACLRTGRALLDAEEWGGFRVLHTSDCIYSDEEGDEGLEDAQSGTRINPSTPRKASKGSVNSKPPSHALPSSEQSVLARRLPTFSSPSASNPMPARTPSSNLTSSAITTSSPKLGAGVSIRTQSSPTRRHSTPTIHQHSHPNFQSSQHASAPTPSPFPQAAATAPFLSQAPGSSISQILSLPTNHSVPQHSPPSGSTDLLHALNYAFQIQNTASQVQSAASQTLTQLVETVIAVAQGQGMDTAVIQNYLATLPMSLPPIQKPPSSHIQDTEFQSVDERPESSVSDSPFRDAGKSSASTYTPGGLVSSELSLPAKRRQKSSEPPFPAKRVTSISRQNPSGPPPERLQPERGIFSAKNGHPLMVFVQIDTRGRHEIVHLIKKNGGKITADIPKAAFVILNPRSVSYADLRQEADDSGRTIVQTSFVMESVKQGHLLDPNDFLLGDASSPRKPNLGGRRFTSSRDRHSPESDHATSEAQTSDTVVDASSSIPAREHSITPEPPAPVQSKAGYKFTPSEMTYTWALVRRIISKDPVASKIMVVRALHKKMPHHSVSSWVSMMSRHKDMYDAARSEALGFTPAYGARSPPLHQRQLTHQLRNETSCAEMNEVGRDTEELEELQVGASLVLAETETMHVDEQQPSPGGSNEDKHGRDAYAIDFEALVGFLTSADADGGREDEIFDRLTAKNICMTAPSWPAFLEQHADAVTEEVERRYKTQQAI